MIQFAMKTYFYLCRKAVNTKGLCPIYCRIANGSNRADFSTGIFISEKDWLPGQGMPKKTLIAENQRLQRLQVDLVKFIFQCENNGVYNPSETLDLFRQHKKPKENYLTAVVLEFIKQTKLTTDMKKKYNYFLKNLQNFFPKIDVKNIDVKKLNSFRDYMINEGFSIETINKKMSSFKKILSFAEQKNMITKSPFYFYSSLRSEQKKPTHLTDKEIESIEKLQLIERLDNVRNLFLFQCYTGLSYADISLYNNENIELHKGMKFYRGERKKTGTTYYFPVTDKIADLAQKIEIISNQKYNAYLKELGAKIGTQKRICSHMARRTFAQLHINNGKSFEAVAVMLGHSSTTITERHYSRAGIDRLINELNGYKVA